MCLCIVLLLCFTACSSFKDAEETAQDIRIGIIAAETIEMKLDLRADYGERVYDYELLFCGDEKNAELTVLAPESIKDFKIKIEDGQTSTEFEGIMLYMGSIAELSETPACAAAMLIDSWKSGYITDCKFENYNGADTTAVTICIDDHRETRTWFDKATSLPLYSELLCDGKAVVFCSFSEVTYR